MIVSLFDLDISTRSINGLMRAGITSLNDLVDRRTMDFSAVKGLGADSVQEIRRVIEQSDEIFKKYAERLERVEAVYPEIFDIDLESLSLGSKITGALRRAGIDSAGDLIRMSRRDVAELASIGSKSRYDILACIDGMIATGRKFIEDTTSATGKSYLLEYTKEQVDAVYEDICDIKLEDLPLSTRAVNALHLANIMDAGGLVRLTKREIGDFQNIGIRTQNEIVSVLNGLVMRGRKYLEDPTAFVDGAVTDSQDEFIPATSVRKGFDFTLINILEREFFFKPTRMSSWFGLSRQRIYEVLGKRPRHRYAKWTGKLMTLEEEGILQTLIESKKPEFCNENVLCLWLNNRRGDFVCLFVYDNDIKCFFLKDLPTHLQDEVIKANLHRFTDAELSGAASGKNVTILKSVYFIPDDPMRFRQSAATRGMSPDDYSVFLTGNPLASSKQTTDEKFIQFMESHLVNGKVYISSDPSNQWVRSFASRNGYSIKEFVEFYGYEFALEGEELRPEAARKRHIEELQQYVIKDHTVYFPTDSHMYRVLQTYAYAKGKSVNAYVEELGYHRTIIPPKKQEDPLETDMVSYSSKGSFVDRIFAENPLLGSKILNQKTIDQLNQGARKIIDAVLENPRARLSLQAKMQITLALINYAKKWKNEENGNFWNYITLQFGYRGYRDNNGPVVRILQSSLEDAIKLNRRFFIEDTNGRAFKSTAVVHALATHKSWMALFDFLFDFYKYNLKWQVLPGDPLIGQMIKTLQRKLSGEEFESEDTELTISSRVYSVQEGIRKLILMRPQFTQALFEKLLKKIDALINSNFEPASTYEEQLCEDWFREKVASIADSKATSRQRSAATREVAIDYTRIRLHYSLYNENTVQLVVPDIRLDREEVRNADLIIQYQGKSVCQRKLDWYGNELGKTLGGVAVSLPAFTADADSFDVRAQIYCDGDVIYDSEESLARDMLVFSGTNEIRSAQITCGNYTFVVPESQSLTAENADATDIDDFRLPGARAAFLELHEGYMLSLGGSLLSFDSEANQEIKVISPPESKELPTVAMGDNEYHLAYRGSTCSVVLGDKSLLQMVKVLKDREQIDLSLVESVENRDSIAFILPLGNDSSTCEMRVIDLDKEKAVYHRTFILVDSADCHFNRSVYCTAEDYLDAVCHIQVGEMEEDVLFDAGTEEVQIPFREGVLHIPVPKVTWAESTGAWMYGQEMDWFIGSVPQESLLYISQPPKTDIHVLVGGQDIRYDGKGVVLIGNTLYSTGGLQSDVAVPIELQVTREHETYSYHLASVHYREHFLKQPEFWSKDGRLYWDQGGRFIGRPDRKFSILMTSDSGEIQKFQMTEQTEFVDLPANMEAGNYCFAVSITIGSFFRKSETVVAEGNCVIGDVNVLRFKDRRIVIEAITDGIREDLGHIRILPCAIDQITFCGMERIVDNDEERICPVYTGVLCGLGPAGERFPFSSTEHTNKRGVKKIRVNPVKIVYVGDEVLSITDPDDDGLYYYFYYERGSGSKVFALTDREYTKENRSRYSTAYLYLYRTERIEKNV